MFLYIISVMTASEGPINVVPYVATTKYLFINDLRLTINGDPLTIIS